MSVTDFLWIFISDFLVTVVWAVIVLSFCEEILGLKNEKNKILFYLISSVFVYSFPKLFLNVNFAADSLVNELINIAAFYISAKIFLKGGLLKTLLLSILGMNIVNLPMHAIPLGLNLLFNISDRTYQQKWSSAWFFGGVVTLTTGYIVVRIAIALFKKTKPSFPRIQIIMLGVYDAFMLVLGIILLGHASIIPEDSYSTRISNIWSFLAVVSVIIAIFVYFILNKKLTVSKFDLWVSENKLNEQRRQMEDVKVQEQQIRKIRHDFKNHITTGLALLNENKLDEAKAYLSEYLDSELTVSKQYINTDYEALNAIVNKKIGICFENDIKVSATISTELGSIAEMDLCIVLFNLFDNAIEACEKIKNDRSVKLDIRQNKSYLVVMISNPIIESVLENNPKLNTTKKDDKNHGVGLNTVKDIVKRYNGILKTEEENNMFTVNVWLQNK